MPASSPLKDTERLDYDELARHVFLSPSTLEEDAEFRATLTQMTHAGLQWGGLLAILGVTVLLLVHWGVLGRPTTWWYPAAMSADVFVVWDKAVVLLACLGAVGLGRLGCRLSGGRAAGSAIALTVAAVSLTHDAFRGILSVEYLVLVYLMAVAVIPYRPWQALLVGLGLTGLFYGLGHYGLPGTAAARPELVKAGHLVRMGFCTVVLTGVSALLYATRYQQHRARQRAEALHDQVADLERAKSRFFADVSDEFRTPLTLLLGSLREALDGRLGEMSDALRNRLDLMTGQTRRMRRLVNQLLDLAAVDEGRLDVSMAEHDLVALAERLLPPFRHWATDVGLSFQTEIPPDRLAVWVDADRVDEILGTLLANAIGYTPEGGTIRVRIERTEAAAVVAVRDTGPGLPDDVRARVFGQDESSIPVENSVRDRADPSAAEDWIGMGVGLAHARALVRRQGGRIDVESEPGFGTEFTVRLPLGREHVREGDVADEDAVVREPEVDVGHWREGRSPSDAQASTGESAADEAPEILVVDDEAEMRDYLRSLLAPTYRVATASDGDAALEHLHEHRSDLVVSDATMPGPDGVALCRAVRGDEALRSTPVILVTTRPDEEARLSGLQAGADAAVAKPFDPLELEARIENLIEIRRIVQDRVRVPDWMEPKTEAVDADDADFLAAVTRAVDEHIDNSTFGVDWLADEMDLSPRHLRRRMKEVTRLSPAGFIRTRRLQHAAALLREGADTVSDVASAVGYRDPSYFSRLFRETFGCSPSEYAKRAPEED